MVEEQKFGISENEDKTLKTVYVKKAEIKIWVFPSGRIDVSIHGLPKGILKALGIAIYEDLAPRIVTNKNYKGGDIDLFED